MTAETVLFQPVYSHLGVKRLNGEPAVCLRACVQAKIPKESGHFDPFPVIFFDSFFSAEIVLPT
jgi:hypothetical protein